MSVQPGVLNKINASRRPIRQSVRSLNQYMVTDNGVSLKVTARNEAVAIAIATVRDNRITANAATELVGVHNYTANFYA